MVFVNGGVVHENVNAPSLGDDDIDHRGDGDGVGYVTADEQMRAAGQGGQRVLGRGAVAVIMDGDARTAGGELRGDGPADTARRAGDQNDLISEIEHSGFPPNDCQ